MPDLRRAWTSLWRRVTSSGPTAPPPRMPAFTREYDAVYARIDAADLGGSDPDAMDLELDLFRVDGRGHRLLDTYSESGAAFALEQYGFLQVLRERGFDPHVSLDATDPNATRMFVHHADDQPDHRLVELVLGEQDITLPDGASCTFLFVQWLMMRDPRATFGPDDNPLPGQTHPGLGLFIRFAYLLKLMSDRIGCDGLSNHPSHPHNGILYGKFCHFVDPTAEGRLRALVRDVDTSDLAQLTRWVKADQVLDQDNVPFVWEPLPQVLPVSRKARAWFNNPEYRAQVDRVLARTHYRVVEQASG